MRARAAEGQRPISIHALLAESDQGAPAGPRISSNTISIHALLAESDIDNLVQLPVHFEFLSTLSLRRATSACKMAKNRITFLSTLSLRRATYIGVSCY